jgi:hypothetical protein
MTPRVGYIQKAAGLFVLIVYVYLAVFGLLAMHHHDMSTAGCPYMIGENSICQMDTVAHIEAWKDASTSTLSIVYILLASVAIAVVFLRYASPPLCAGTHARHKTPWTTLYQQLFSSGILHPKAP